MVDLMLSSLLQLGFIAYLLWQLFRQKFFLLNQRAKRLFYSLGILIAATLLIVIHQLKVNLPLVPFALICLLIGFLGRRILVKLRKLICKLYYESPRRQDKEPVPNKEAVSKATAINKTPSKITLDKFDRSSVKRLLLDKVFKFLALTNISIVSILTILILAIILIEAAIFFKEVPISKIFGTSWSPQIAETDYNGLGMLPLLWGSFYVSLLSMIAAIPLSLLTAIFLSEYLNNRIRLLIKPIIELLAAIPTVVYGYIGVWVIAPMVTNFGDRLGFITTNETILAAGIVMGFMLMPFIVTSIDDILKNVPENIKQASIALGASKSQMIRQVLLHASKPGMIAVFLLSFLRAFGETIIVSLIAGFNADISLNPFTSQTTVTTQIVMLLTGDQEFNSVTTRAAFVLGLMLLAISLIINLVTTRVIAYYRRNYKWS